MSRAVRTLFVLALAATAAAALSACESTQDKSARLKIEAEKAQKEAEKGLAVGARNKDIKVKRTVVLRDQYGTAVAVQLHNTGKTQVSVPIAVKVKDRRGDVLYDNTGPGLEPALNFVPVIRAGETTWWVNDQVNASSPPRKATVKVGTSKKPAPATLPEMKLSPLRIAADQDGISAIGTVQNPSRVEQRRLTIFITAQKGNRVVAVGRAVVEKAPGPTPKPIRFTTFFIGNPRGARLSATAPASTLP